MGRRIPDEVIEEIRHRSDIVDVIGSYVALKRVGGRFKACCPFHQEKTPSFIVSPERQAFHCFGCGAGGNVFNFVMKKENVDFPDAAHLLASRCGVVIPEIAEGGAVDREKTQRRERLYSLHKDLAEFYAENLDKPEAKIAADYLAGRGLDREHIIRFGIGYSPNGWDATLNWARGRRYKVEELKAGGLVVESDGGRVYDRFRGRLMFPIWNEQGKVIAFSGRSLEADVKGAKYVNSPETPIFTKGKTLYAFAKARGDIGEKKTAIVCEGQMDVIAMHRAGFANAVAPQGTAFTADQAALLHRYAEKIVLCFDGDAAGVKAVSRSLDILLPMGFAVEVASPPTGEDPDSLFRQGGRDAIDAVINGAADFLEFLWDKKAATIRNDDDKAKVIGELLETLNRIDNQIRRESHIAKLAAKSGVSQAAIFGEVNKLRRKNAFHLHAADRRVPPPPPSSGPREKTAAEKAEALLLELSLRHGTVPKRLDAELSHDAISDSPVGKALNIVIQMAINGEWENAPDAINAALSQEGGNDPDLSRALTAEEKDPERFDLNKAVGDCVNTIKHARAQQRVEALRKQLAEAPDDAKSAILTELSDLKREQLSFRKPAVPAER